MYVLVEGQLWKFSRKNWKRYLNCSAIKGSCELPESFGAKSIQTYVPEVVDWTTQDFAMALAAPESTGCPR